MKRERYRNSAQSISAGCIYRECGSRYPQFLHEALTGIGNDDAPLAMLFALLDGSVFRRAQCRRSAKAAAVELKKALRDKDIPDAIKIGLLPILERAGYPIGDDEARAYFRDFKAKVKRRTLELAKALSDAPVPLRRLLSVKGVIADEENAACPPLSAEAAGEILNLGRRMVKVNPAGATLLAAAIALRAGARDFSNERAAEQLDGIHALGTPSAPFPS